MVDHRSTGLPECGPTESSAPEPCCSVFLLAINIHHSPPQGPGKALKYGAGAAALSHVAGVSVR